MNKLLPNFVTNRLNFLAPMETPPINFSFDQAQMAVNDAQYRYTPDACLLSQYNYLPVFIYDRLMEGRDDHDLIMDHIQPAGPVGFTRDSFTCWRKNLGKLSFPIALETNRQANNPAWADLARETCWFKDAPPALVKGIVHILARERIYELDKHYRNTVNFQRKKVLIQIPCRPKEKASSGNEYMMRLWCWMYLGIQEHWEPQLDGGYFFSPVRIFKPKNELLSEYSFFEQPTGEVPKEEEPVKFTKWTTMSFPLFEGNRVVGSGFEMVEVETPVEENPYRNQLDGASPVQRIINEDS